MTEVQGSVLAGASLRRLASDTDFACAESFAETFQSMLAGRVDRIVRALGERDADTALDAVLSLKISSAMAGAEQMASLCASLESELRAGSLPADQLLCSHLCLLEAALQDRTLELPPLDPFS